jgi:rhamnogalacturonan endolyase
VDIAGRTDAREAAEFLARECALDRLGAEQAAIYVLGGAAAADAPVLHPAAGSNVVSYREFRHGDHYWQWGLYFDYPKEFPHDVNFVVGKSDWRRDWNYVQPPRIESREVPMASEEDEQKETAAPPAARARNISSSTWSISFVMPERPQGKATLRLAFCGTHLGCHVEAFVNGNSIGDTGTLPSTSAMQRDGIRAYWIEKDLSFDATLLARGTNSVKLLSHANSWSQGVMYDCVRLELDETKP